MSSSEHPHSIDELFPELLHQAQLGDSTAMGHLLELPREHLLAIARRRIPAHYWPRMAPSDAVQQALESAYRHFAKFRGSSEGEFIEWLRAILVNTIKDFLRAARGRRGQHADLVISLETPAAKAQMAVHQSGERSVCDSLIKQEKKAIVNRCLEMLPEPYRKVLQFRYDQPHAWDEIAASLGVSSQAAMKLRSRALRALVHLVDAYKIIDEET